MIRWDNTTVGCHLKVNSFARRSMPPAIDCHSNPMSAVE